MINFFSKYKFIFYLSNFILIVLYLFPGSLLGCFYIMIVIATSTNTRFFSLYKPFYAFCLLSIIGLFTYKNSDKLNFLIFILFYFQ